MLDYKRQTQLKHAILEKYLWAWLRILGKRVPLLYYVDGFAGEGSYWDEEKREIRPGSPVIAAKVYLEHKAKGEPYELKFINVESKEANWEHLQKVTEEFKSKADIDNIRGEFLDHIDEILQRIGSAVAFFFIDPFGISGIGFRELERVFARQNTEILLNFHYDGLQRCLGELKNREHSDATTRAKAIATIDTVSQMMGLGIHELEALEKPDALDMPKEKRVLASYLANLRRYKRCVYPFKNRFPGSQRTFYYLVFMTDNSIGLKIMKDVMYLESRRELQQLLLFPPAGDTSSLVDKLFNSYRGKTIKYYTILEEWLSKCQYTDSEDYLEKDVLKALDCLQAEGSLRTFKGAKYKYPLYVFEMARKHGKS
jgi:three-Cys-motif partner protein